MPEAPKGAPGFSRFSFPPWPARPAVDRGRGRLVSRSIVAVAGSFRGRSWPWPARFAVDRGRGRPASRSILALIVTRPPRGRPSPSPVRRRSSPTPGVLAAGRHLPRAFSPPVLTRPGILARPPVRPSVPDHATPPTTPLPTPVGQFRSRRSAVVVPVSAHHRPPSAPRSQPATFAAPSLRAAVAHRLDAVSVATRPGRPFPVAVRRDEPVGDRGGWGTGVGVPFREARRRGPAGRSAPGC
jgi:hypothetical protein